MGVTVIRSRPKPSEAPTAGEPLSGEPQPSVTVRLEGFTSEALAEESARLGVSVQELVAYAVTYYLADVDSGRVARRLSREPYPDSDAPS
jgi:hypothetical protein